ncbi:hypothetical protein XC93_25140 [Klebsiella variicola]|nr:hypothetical protein [Klebsiella variicola]MDT7028303.1 hypothetical protein [Klebsiella variicola]
MNEVTRLLPQPGLSTMKKRLMIPEQKRARHLQTTARKCRLRGWNFSRFAIVIFLIRGNASPACEQPSDLCLSELIVTQG